MSQAIHRTGHVIVWNGVSIEGYRHQWTTPNTHNRFALMQTMFAWEKENGFDSKALTKTQHMGLQVDLLGQTEHPGHRIGLLSVIDALLPADKHRPHWVLIAAKPFQCVFALTDREHQQAEKALRSLMENRLRPEIEPNQVYDWLVGLVSDSIGGSFSVDPYARSAA